MIVKEGRPENGLPEFQAFTASFYIVRIYEEIVMKKAGVLVLSFLTAASLIACGGAFGESSHEPPAESTAVESQAAENLESTPEPSAQPEETVFPAAEVPQIIFDETQTSMLKPADAILLTEYLTRLYYDPADAVTYWTTLYYYLSVYGPLTSGGSYAELEDGQYLVLGVDAIREAGRVVFGETTAMPEIPETIHRISLHEDGYYYIKMDPRPQSVPELVSGIVNSDGTCDIVARLCDTNGRSLCVESFHLVPKTGVNSLLGVEYYYTISSVGLG